jgi:hypothetical protein
MHAIHHSPGDASHLLSYDILPSSGPSFHVPTHSHPDAHPLLELFSEEKDVEDRDEKKGHSHDIAVPGLWAAQSLSLARSSSQALSATLIPNFLRFCSLRL